MEKSVRDFLARNRKIRLSSEMSEKRMMREVQSVFEVAMGKDKDFPFKILQNSGGSSRSLRTPAVSSSLEKNLFLFLIFV